MSDAEIQQALANAGLIYLNPSPPGPEPRTFLVSGVARSGTSLLAKLLQMIGIPLGPLADGVVFEDTDMAQALEQPDRTALRQLIMQRNEEHSVWGFKRPNLFNALAPRELELFRSPFLVLTFRDPVAIAQRNIISNMSFVGESLQTAADDLGRLIDFALRARCPTLLVSYEKALTGPGRLVDALLAFGGWSADAALSGRLIAAVTVDNPVYWRMARVEVRGFIDGVRDGKLRGWCSVTGFKDPARLELLVDGRAVTGFRADQYREDLAKAGIGDGRHGFMLDLAPFALGEEVIVTVRVKDRDFVLTHSGRTVRQLTGMV